MTPARPPPRRPWPADPATFWNSVDPTMLPAHLRLHHTFPTRDGTRLSDRAMARAPSRGPVGLRPDD